MPRPLVGAGLWSLACGLLCAGLGGDTLRAVQDLEPVAGRRARIFYDCTGDDCDPDFVRRELRFAEFVRDRAAADVHVLVTSRRTGSGGREFELEVVGCRQFSGASLHLRATTGANASADQRRTEILRVLKAAVAPFVSQSADGPGLAITVEPSPAVPGRALPTADPWNHWVMQSGLTGFSAGESSLSTETLAAFVSGNRVTETWKLLNVVNVVRTTNRFRLDDGRRITSGTSSLDASTLAGLSLGDHWSAGVVGSLKHATFFNQDLYVRVGPVVEWNLFPYAQSSTKQLTLQYSPGFRAYDYIEETIFLETSDRLIDQTAGATLSLIRPWGSVTGSVSASVFLRDPSQHRVDSLANLDLRIGRGLSFRFGGNAAWIHDQIYLPRQGSSLEEVLLRRRQLATSYSYQFSVGLTYTFGSLFNTVVNPRFVGLGGS